MISKFKLYFKIFTYLFFFALGVFITIQFKSCGGINKECPQIKDSFAVHYEYKTVIDTIEFKRIKTITIGVNSGFDSTKYKGCPEFRNDSINLTDTLIEGNILLGIQNNQLKEYKFSYIPKFPKYIHQIDSVFVDSLIYKTQTIPISRKILYLSLGAGTRENSVGLALKTKKDYIFGYRFGINMNAVKSHNIEMKIPLIKFKK